MRYSEQGVQYHLQIKSGDIGKYVILPGDPKRCVKIAQYLENPQLIADNREYVTYSGYLNGEMVSVTSTGIGGPSAAIVLEELVRAGAHTFIRIGTCGGMDINVVGGDLVIPTAAVRMEGTSKEYAPIEFPAAASHEIVNALSKAADVLSYKKHIGIVECKDSFYGEHEPEKMPVNYELENKWKAWLKLGCLASEMESAALYVVASYLHVKIGTVLHVMANQEREAAGIENIVVHDTNKAIEVGINALKDIIESDR